LPVPEFAIAKHLWTLILFSSPLLLLDNLLALIIGYFGWAARPWMLGGDDLV
jgi:hypothetical protein